MIRTTQGLWEAASALLLLLACTASEQKQPALLRIDEAPLIRGPVSPSGLQAILGTNDVGVGTNRVGFVLVSPKELIRLPEVAVTSFYRPSESSVREPREEVKALFHPWPYGVRGLYTTELTFDRAGQWGLGIRIAQEEGPPEEVSLFFDVREVTATPLIGAQAPPSQNRTVRDVAALEELTSGSLMDPDLYQSTIATAAASGLPTVVVFASPAVCINEVCGPQVEVLQQIKDLYKGQAHFIHVDLYDNPHEIQGDLAQARISPVVVEWSLPSIEWTFVLDRQGRIAAKFEAFATIKEVEEALKQVL